MALLNVKDMHERLMLYKMVRQVVEKSKNHRIKQGPWLCNVYSGNNRGEK
ncbi:MAG: hypothetical protein GXW85_04180 [Clostridia bacterium]|nr:hypothetical protein [Clostridia bacterium]